MELGSMMDAIVFACGIYLLYSTIVMKRTGEIKNGWLISKNINLNKSKDKLGYIEYMYIRYIIFSICTCLFGIVGFYSNYIQAIAGLQLAATILFLIAVIWFTMVSIKATRKYLTPR